MSQLETQMRHRDHEMVPGMLVKAMFALMALSLSIVAYAQWTNHAQVGVLQEAPVAASKDIVMIGDRSGLYQVFDTSGTLLTTSEDDLGGFIGVIGRAIDRERQLHAVSGDLPISVIRRENGNIAIADPATGMSVELIGYGKDNVAAFAQFVN